MYVNFMRTVMEKNVFRINSQVILMALYIKQCKIFIYIEDKRTSCKEVSTVCNSPGNITHSTSVFSFYEVM
jgi:hypothetical protein